MKVKQTCSYGRWMREAYHSVVLPLTKGRWKKLLFQLAKNIYRRDTEIDNLLVRNYHFVFPCDYNWTDSLCVMENNILLHGGCWKMNIVCYYYLRGYLNMYLKSETTDTFWWWIRFSDSSFLNFLFWLRTLRTCVNSDGKHLLFAMSYPPYDIVNLRVRNFFVSVCFYAL